MVLINRFASATARFGRWAIAGMLCTLVLLANVQPAAAFGNSSSKSSDGIVQLDQVEQQAKDVLKQGPRGMQEVTTRADGGLNGVQGGADLSKMSNPENSQDATTVKESIKDAIESLND